MSADLWLDLFKAALSAGHAPSHAEFCANEALAIVQKRRGADAAIDSMLAAASDVDRRFSALAAVKGDPGCAEYLRRLREAATCVRMGRQP